MPDGETARRTELVRVVAGAAALGTRPHPPGRGPQRLPRVPCEELREAAAGTPAPAGPRRRALAEISRSCRRPVVRCFRGEAHRRAAGRWGHPLAVAARTGALRAAKGRAQARASSSSSWGSSTRSQVTQTLSRQLSVPWVSLYHVDFSRSLLNLVPREIAEQVLPRARSSCGACESRAKRSTSRWTTRPTRAPSPRWLSAAGLPVKPMIACPSDIRGGHPGLLPRIPARPEPAASAPQLAPSPAPPAPRRLLGAVASAGPACSRPARLPYPRRSPPHRRLRARLPTPSPRSRPCQPPRRRRFRRHARERARVRPRSGGRRAARARRRTCSR